MIGKGSIELKLGPKRVPLHGGPFRAKPEGFFGVSMAAEIEPKDSLDLHVEVPDFGIPAEDRISVAMAMITAACALSHGQDTYVGCMGGQGRTGIFMALMARAAYGMTGPEAIHFVREHYLPHAVETAEQEAYVANFVLDDLPEIFREAGWAGALWFLPDAFNLRHGVARFLARHLP